MSKQEVINLIEQTVKTPADPKINGARLQPVLKAIVNEIPEGGGGGGGSAYAVVYNEPQQLTPEQRNIARNNIEAASSDGENPNCVAGDIIPKKTVASPFTHKYAGQSTGGDADLKNGNAFLNSIKGTLVRSNGVLVPFLADTFVSTGMNLVNSADYLTILGLKAYFFPVVPGSWGSYGTTEQNNGYKVIASSNPSGVYFSPTKPTASIYGKECTFHEHDGVKYYTPAAMGWMIVIMPNNEVPACHLEWSGKYENVAGTFGNTNKAIGAAMQAVHPWGLSGLVGADRSSYDELDFVLGKGYARNDRELLSSLTWSMTTYTDDQDAEHPVTHHVFTATVSGMAVNGLWDCIYDGLVVENTTITIDSTTITTVEALVASFTADDLFYYEKASVTSSNISNAAALRANTVNDYGLSYFMYNNELVTTEAYVTEEFYQSAKDRIFNNIDYVEGEMSEVLAAALAEHEEKINGIIEGFRRGLPSLRVEELTIARKLNSYVTEGNAELRGAGAPTVIPRRNGQEYFDTTNNVWYKASYTGTAPTAAAWKPITNA